MEKKIDLPERFDRDAFIAEVSALLDSIADGGERIILDLSRTDVLNTGGISALIEVQTKAARKKTIIRLTGLSEQMRLILVLSKLDDRFEIEGL